MRLADLGREVILGKRRFDAGYQIPAVCLVIRVLELASAAFRKMATGRLLVMRTGGQRAIIEQRISRNPKCNVPAARRHAVPASSNADDQFVHSRQASAAGMASA